MLPFYREITYRAWTPEFHERVQARADDLPGVDILLSTLRPMGWLERDRLFADQYLCRTVLAIVSRDDELQAALAGGGDPYRATFDEFIREVRPDVSALIDEIDADHREVKAGRLGFRTKEIPDGRGETLVARLRRLAKAMNLRLEVSRRDHDGQQHILEGRAFGSILGIHRLSRTLLGSPFVLPARLSVAFE
jgi:hypothetical protein